MRRLIALINGLPPGGALHRSIDPARVDWSQTDELLATLVEVVDIGNRDFAAVHSDKGSPPRKPIRVPRPGHEAEPAPARRQATPEEMRAFFGGAIRYTGKAGTADGDG